MTVSCVTKETCCALVTSWTDTVPHSVNERLLLRLPSSWALTHAQPEVIEGMSVDAIQLANHSDSKFHHDPDLCLLPLSVLKERNIQEANYDCCVDGLLKLTQLVSECDTKHQLLHLIVLWHSCPTEPCSSHVSAANRLDLLHPTELWLGQELWG